MKTPEAEEKDKLVEYLDSIGCFHFAPNTGGYGKSGIPDRIACIDGRFVALEVKSSWGKPTASQLRCMVEIRKAGGTAIWGTADELIRIVAAMLWESRPQRD